jgi:hypothetical protein
MFEDEGRFGRCGHVRRSWAPPHVRPVCKTQVAREYTYAFAAVDPLDGGFASLILPRANLETTGMFLKHLGGSFPEETVLLFMDRAGWHSSRRLEIPDNVRLDFLPPYSPQLNPVEHVWKRIRQNGFSNRLHADMDAVQNTLCDALREMHASPQTVKSFAGFDWIVTSLMKET